MKKSLFSITIIILVLVACGGQAKRSESLESNADTVMKKDYIQADIYETNQGILKVTLIGHGSVMFEYMGKIIHVDPYSQVADYNKLPKADLVLLTHEHSDHLDTLAINAIKKDDTHYIVSKTCNEILGYGNIVGNGDHTHWANLHIDVVPAYNIVNKRPDGQAYHPKGRGNGYIITFGDKTVYIAGDTENIPEMDILKDKIDIAFMPKNLPYTMNDEMFIDAAKKVKPKVLYPYHMAEFDKGKIEKSLANDGIKIEVRPMKN